jgi:hypothetical protein
MVAFDVFCETEATLLIHTSAVLSDALVPLTNVGVPSEHDPVAAIAEAFNVDIFAVVLFNVVNVLVPVAAIAEAFNVDIFAVVLFSVVIYPFDQ